MLAAGQQITLDQLLALGGVVIAAVGVVSVPIMFLVNRLTRKVESVEAKVDSTSKAIHDRIDEHMTKEERENEAQRADLANMREAVAHIAGVVGLPPENIRRLRG